MAFIVEFASEDNIKKYQLNRIRYEYEHSKSKTPSTRFVSEREINTIAYPYYNWVFDQTRDIWLMYVEVVMAWVYNDSINQAQIRILEPTRENIFFLSYQGELFKISVWNAVESSNSYRDFPYRKVWENLTITPNTGKSISEKKLIDLVKETLTLFSQKGGLWQVPNTEVEFKF